MVASVQGFGGEEAAMAYEATGTMSNDNQPGVMSYDAQPGTTSADTMPADAKNDPSLYGGPALYGGGGGVSCPSGSLWLGAGNYCISDNVWACTSAGASTSTMVSNCGNGCEQFAPGQQISTEYGGGGGGMCPTGYDWGGPGDYCIFDNIYYCQASGQPTTNMKTNCGTAGCQIAPAGSADYCKPNPPDAYCKPVSATLIASNSVCSGTSFTHVPGSPYPGFYTPESCGEAAQMCVYNNRYSYNPTTKGCLCAQDSCSTYMSWTGWNVYQWGSSSPAPMPGGR